MTKENTQHNQFCALMLVPPPMLTVCRRSSGERDNIDGENL